MAAVLCRHVSFTKLGLCILVASSSLAILPSTPTFAKPLLEPQERVKEEEQIAAELANPLAPITTLSMQYRSEFGNGPDDEVNHQLRLLPSFF